MSALTTKARHCVALGLILGVPLVLAGCGYGKVSPAAYEYATALYSIANRKAEEKLAEVSAQLDQSAAEGTVSDREAGWLRSIISDAQQGRWDSAAGKARELLEDQVSRGRN